MKIYTTLGFIYIYIYIYIYMCVCVCMCVCVTCMWTHTADDAKAKHVSQAQEDL